MKSLRVLVTRPEAQTRQLAEYLSKAGFQPISAPMIRIEPLLDENSQKNIAGAIANMMSADGAIAISANAARLCAKSISQHAVQVPENFRWFAVGNATADALREAGYEPVIPETTFSSEGLLALPDFQGVESKRFVILAGQDGRKKLEDTLRARGAIAERIEFYRRVALKPEEIQVAEHPDAIIVMSGETLDALENYLNVRSLESWLTKPIIVPSARIAEQAFNAGHINVRLTKNATEKSLMQVLSRLASEV